MLRSFLLTHPPPHTHRTHTTHPKHPLLLRLTGICTRPLSPFLSPFLSCDRALEGLGRRRHQECGPTPYYPYYACETVYDTEYDIYYRNGPFTVLAPTDKAIENMLKVNLPSLPFPSFPFLSFAFADTRASRMPFLSFLFSPFPFLSFPSPSPSLPFPFLSFPFLSSLSLQGAWGGLPAFRRRIHRAG